MQVWRLVGILAVVSVVTSASAIDHTAEPPSKKALVPASEADRTALIQSALTWLPPDRQGRSLLEGPKQKKPELDFAFNQSVTCQFIEPDPKDPPGGKTPKFDCGLPDGKTKIRVKYATAAEANLGIYGEVLSTRLLWALGFPVDAIYPVKVTCQNCPQTPWRFIQKTLEKPNWRDPNPRTNLVIDAAVIEVKNPARPIERFGHQGWSWKTDFAQMPADPNLKIQREALALLAALVQHADNKPEQQRLVCLDDGGDNRPQAACKRSALMIQDLGFTFGQGFQQNLDRNLETASVAGFAKAPLWKNSASCDTHIDFFAFTGESADTRITEAGRAFLADKLTRLTDQDLTDLFTAVRLDLRKETVNIGGSAHVATVADWIAVFRARMNLVLNKRCPSI